MNINHYVIHLSNFIYNDNLFNCFSAFLILLFYSVVDSTIETLFNFLSHEKINKFVLKNFPIKQILKDQSFMPLI